MAAPRPSTGTSRFRGAAGAGLLAAVVLGALGQGKAPASDAMATTVAASPELPALLSQTGLYLPGGRREIDPAHFAFSPQYPLWSDGTTKRRWLRLPPGTAIDASRSDAWQFPPGTRLWKEFSYGRPVETRMIERLADGSWRFSAYVWKADGSDAVLAPETGIDAVPVSDAPVAHYVIPSQDDCRACHDGAEVPVLGLSALQSSQDRDPLAPHASPPANPEGDLRALIARGWLRNAPRSLLDDPPRIPARSDTERAALGYLHANCGHCHNTGEKAVPVRLALAGQWRDGKLDAETVLASAQAYALRAPRAEDGARPLRVVPGDVAASILAQRMRSRHPQTQMPPIGTRLVDDEGLALVERWITTLPKQKDTTP